MIWLCGSISMMPTLYHHDPLASGQIRTTSSAGGPTRIFCSLWASATSTKGCFRDGRLEDHGRSPWRNRLTRWFLLTVGFLRLIYAQIPEVSSGCFPSFSAFHFLVYSIYIPWKSVGTRAGNLSEQRADSRKRFRMTASANLQRQHAANAQKVGK